MPDADPYFEVHPGRGPYALLVHGMLSSRAQWAPNLAALSEVVRPVVVELFGHGRSPAPEERAAYHPDAYVRAFERLRERLGCERWMVIGQSLGAALTVRYALDLPERVICGIATNSNSAFADSAWGEGVRAGMQRFEARVVAEGLEALERMPIHPKHARRLPQDLLAPLLEDAALANPRGVALSAAETAPSSPLFERLHENRVPTLLVCGVNEKAFELNRKRAEARMPALEVCELPGGHAVNLHAVPGFNHAACGFLAKWSPGV